jgi:hypothetical protein
MFLGKLVKEIGLEAGDLTSFFSDDTINPSCCSVSKFHKNLV